jgi:hypothetical protein
MKFNEILNSVIVNFNGGERGNVDRSVTFSFTPAMGEEEEG